MGRKQTKQEGPTVIINYRVPAETKKAIDKITKDNNWTQGKTIECLVLHWEQQKPEKLIQEIKIKQGE